MKKITLKFFGLLLLGAGTLASCDDDGLTAGDPNYFTSSRGQFTGTLEDGTSVFLLPGSTDGTATITYDGSKPLHTVSLTVLTVWVDTYQDDIDLSQTVTGRDGKTYTITAIDKEAFMGCRNFSTYESNGLTSIKIPSTITSIGEGAFCYTSLETIDLTDAGITEIPLGCFGRCTSLVSAVIPASITTIGQQAFSDCNNLTTLKLEEGLETIGERAFYGCENLRVFNGTDGTGSDRTFTIPASVTSIGKMAFSGMKCSIVDLSQSSIKSLPEGAFSACSNIQKVTLPEGLETIGAQAFYDCRNTALTEITIPESVTKIGDKAFGGRGAVLDTKKGESVDWISYITAYHMKSATPPTLEGVLYEADKVSSTPTIYVPTGSLEAYKAADGWSSLNIEEE